MSGKLTTHILDTSRGKPGAGILVELRRIEAGGGAVPIAALVTGPDGRIGQPLIAGSEFIPGIYELVVHAGDYYSGPGMEGQPQGGPAFLDLIPIRIGIANSGEHVHVPVLMTPWSYSVYRGSG